MNPIAEFVKKSRKEAGLTQEEFANLMNFMKINDIHGFITAGNVSEIYGDWNNKKHRKKISQ